MFNVSFNFLDQNVDGWIFSMLFCGRNVIDMESEFCEFFGTIAKRLSKTATRILPVNSSRPFICLVLLISLYLSAE